MENVCTPSRNACATPKRAQVSGMFPHAIPAMPGDDPPASLVFALFNRLSVPVA